MSDILDRIDWKLRRAATHANAANDLAKSFLKSEHYRTVFKKYGDGRFVYKIVDVDPFPAPFSVYIGEAAHQLRSTLNHIMYAIANPSTSKEQEQVEFPLVSRRRKFYGRLTRKGNRDGGVSHKMPGVPRGVKTLVERLQPYHRRKWPQTALLGQIQVINNLDKHRALLAGFTAAEGIDPCFSNLSGATIEYEVFDRVFKPNTILIRGTIKHPPGRRNVRMQPEIHVLPVFDTGMPREIRGQPIIRTIGRAGEFIRQVVVPMFERFF